VISKIYKRDALINSTKALVGHTIGASGAIEAAVTAFSLRDGWVHGMPHLENPIAELNFAASTVSQEIDIGVSHSFAFGGHNTALLLRRAG
jgi:3-oxoacyl-[acyl-carrier-protein] synthase II